MLFILSRVSIIIFQIIGPATVYIIIDRVDNNGTLIAHHSIYI